MSQSVASEPLSSCYSYEACTHSFAASQPSLDKITQIKSPQSRAYNSHARTMSPVFKGHQAIFR